MAALDSTRLYARLNGTLTDITSYFIEPTRFKWGMEDNDPLELVAGTGEWTFILNNQAGVQFLPEAPSALAGWSKGTMVQLILTFDGEPYVRFRGYVEKVRPASGPQGHKWVTVTALDWMQYAAKHPIVNPGVLTNQRGDDVIRTVVGLMPKQPQAMQLDAGVSVFPTTFDTVTSQTRALSEFGKVALSEPGSVYLRKDRVNGETLVFENSQHWNGLKALSTIPIPASASDTLVQEDTDGLLQEDGDTILVNEAQSFSFNNFTMDEETEHGEQVINRFTVYANPRKIDTSAQVLFTLNEPILIGSGQTIEIRGTYADPAGGLPINANPSDMITPVATTDYLVNTAQNGSGTNITSSLVLVEIRYGSEGFTHFVRNDSVNAGYITKWSPRGKGIYQYNPIEHVETDLDSIANDWGTQPESVTQAYQNTLIQGTLFGKQVVFEYAWPQQILKKIHFNPNSSTELMLAFLNGDVGSYFAVTVTNKNIDEHVAVRGVEFTLDPGGFIMCTWLVKYIRTLLKGLSPIAVEFRGGSNKDAIDFGYLPEVSGDDVTKFSMSAWINMDTVPVASDYIIMGPFLDGGGTMLYVDNHPTDRVLAFYSSRFGTSPGKWRAPNNAFGLSSWVQVGVSYDIQVSADPTIIINGVSQTLTEEITPAGTLKSGVGAQFVFGNWKTATQDYDRAFDGKIKDGRFYKNKILTSTEWTTLYNSGTPDPNLVTDGLTFRAFAVKTKDLADYIDQTLDENLKVVEDVFRMVGVPYGSPIGRTP